jgi:D-Tyr-tRNAtyr deacylase
VEAYILLHKNTAALVTVSKETDREVNAEKTKNMVMFQDQQAGKNHNINTGNKSFQWVEQFTYLRTTMKNHNSIHEEIKSRLKSGNACHQSVEIEK